MKKILKRLICLLRGHDKTYIRFGPHKIPYSCKRCGAVWNSW